MASVPFLSCKFFAKQKTYETIVTGLRAGPQFWFCGVLLRKTPGMFFPKWRLAPIRLANWELSQNGETPYN
jgi:hypothetical protein